MINLSYLDDDHFCGRFNLPAGRIQFVLRQGECLIFPANFVHCASGAGPYDVPVGDRRRLSRGLPMPVLAPGTKHKRVVIPVYPNLEALEPKFYKWNIELWSQIGGKMFELKRGQQSFMMRTFIVNEEANIELLDEKDPALLLDNTAGKGSRLLTEAAELYKVNSAAQKKLDAVTAKSGGNLKATTSSIREQRRKTAAAASPVTPFAYQPPAYYVRLFASNDDDAGTQAFLLELAQETLTAVQTPNTEHLADMAFVGKMNCGYAPRIRSQRRARTRIHEGGCDNHAQGVCSRL